MRLALTQDVPASPGVTWRYLTEPELMNRWSRARIELVETGDEGRPDTVGTLRRVYVSAGPRTTRLHEVVQVSDAPRRFVYRVFDDPLIAKHRGEISLDPTGRGTRVTWTVDFEMRLGIDQVAGRMLTPALEASLKALAERIHPIEPARPMRVFYDEPDHDLWSVAERVLLEQRALADRLERDRDPKRHFSRVYEFVTEAQLGWARARSTLHVAWVLRLIPVFHRYYVQNLEARQRGKRCELQWREAFDAMEGKIGRKKNDERFRTGYGLLKGIRAHIEEDLPRALAEVWAAHYAGRADYDRLRADYLLMGGIFDGSTDRMIERNPGMMPWYAARLPRMLQEEWRRRNFYDVRRARRLAFERGGRLAEMLSNRSDREPAPAPPAKVSRPA